MDMQSASKVGLLLVVFVGLFIGAYAVLGKSLFAPKADTYFATLSDAGGITQGTRILMAGVDIGTVSTIALTSPTEAKLTLSIVPGTKIPSGSSVLLPTSFIGFGDTSINIVPPESFGNTLIQPGTTLPGRKASALDGVLPDSKTTINELNRTMVAMRKLLEDQKMQNRVSDLLATTNKTLTQFGNLAANANQVVAKNQASIAQAIQAAAAAVQDVHKVTIKVAELVQSGKLQKDAVAIMDRVKVISEHANELLVSMNKLVNDPKLRDPINQSVANVADITNTGKTIAANTAEMTKNGIAITENVSTISKKAITLTDKATEIASKASQIEDQLKGVLDKVGGFFNKAPNTKDLPQITTEMNLFRQSHPGYWRTDFGISVPIKDSTLHLGLYDAFESDRLTAQLGRSVTSTFGYRYGVYASKPGLGVDFRLAPRLSLRGDAWDINDPRLDLRASYELGNGFLGWFGVDRVLKDNAITFGVGVRR